MIGYLLIILLIIALGIVTVVIRTKIWNSHKKIVTSGEMTEEEYEKEVEQFGIYTPNPAKSEKPKE